MPRTPRNPGAGKAPANGPSRGAGWGGPAKGKVPAGPRTDFSDDVPGNRAGQIPMPPEKAERVAAYRQKMWDIMHCPEEPTQNQIAAIDRLWDRDEGKPLAKEERSGETVIRVVTGVPRAGRD